MEISGSDFNDEQSANKQYIFVTFLVFYLEISGNEINDEQLSNKQSILLIFLKYISILLKNCIYQT